MRLPLPRRRIWRAGIYIGSFLLVLVAADMVLVQMRRTIHPGFDTTRIVAPLKEDGSVDYLIAVDNQFGAGVTPENNAAIPILQASGRKAIPPYQPLNGLTDRLGMPPLPEKGDYFIAYDDYCKQHAVTPTQWTDLTSPRPWPVTFDEITMQWIKDSGKPLALFTEASKRPRFFIPFYAGYRPETMIEILLPHARFVRDACRALQTRAQMRLAADDVAGFRADLMTVRRIARLLGQQGTMIERIVAITIETSACEAERVGISSGKLSAEQARAMITELAALGDLPPMADALDMGERYFALDTLQLMARKGPIRAGQLICLIGDMPERRFGPSAIFLLVPIQYEAAMRNINHFNDGALAVLRQPTYPQRVAALQLAEQKLNTKDVKELTLGNLSGPDWPIQVFAPALRRALEREETAGMESRLTRLALMLFTYKADHGTYPETLAELSPDDPSHVARDLFAEKPLIYSRNASGYTLYSIGPNMTDDGGKSEKPGDDIVASTP